MIDNIILILLLLILTAKIIGSLFERIGLDGTIGQLLTGIIFGPSLLNIIHAESIESFAIIGSVLILFVAGMKQRDIGEIYEDKPALKIGLTLLIVTAIIMSIFFYFVPRYFGIEFSIFQTIVMGLAFAVVDIGVPAKILMSKGLINQPVGKIIIRSSIVNIILGLLLFTIVTLFVSPNLTDIVITTAGMILFLVITIGLVYFFSKIAKFIMKMHIEEAEFSMALILVLAMAYFTDLIGFSSVLGAFIAGVLISRTSFAETRSFSNKIESISFGLFVPLFFVWFGLEIHLSDIWNHIILAVLIFLTYATIRFLITYAYMKKYKIKMPGLISSSMLSVDVESLVILMVSLQLGFFITDMPLTLFAPSVFFSTFFIVVLVAVFSKIEKAKKTKKKIKFIS